MDEVAIDLWWEQNVWWTNEWMTDCTNEWYSNWCMYVLNVWCFDVRMYYMNECMIVQSASLILLMYVCCDGCMDELMNVCSRSLCVDFAMDVCSNQMYDVDCHCADVTIFRCMFVPNECM